MPIFLVVIEAKYVTTKLLVPHNASAKVKELWNFIYIYDEYVINKGFQEDKFKKIFIFTVVSYFLKQMILKQISFINFIWITSLVFDFGFRLISQQVILFIRVYLVLSLIFVNHTFYMQVTFLKRKNRRLIK